MRWEGREQSENVEDRRGMPVKGLAAGGGIATLLLVLIITFMGGDPSQLLQQAQEGGGQPGAPRPKNAQEDKLAEMVGVVLKDTEDVWTKLFQEVYRKPYVKPKLQLFTGSTQSACGHASAAMGPFYCPPEEKVFIDLAFCDELRTRLKAPGDFAVAYVIAHEVGHHVQNQLGYSEFVHQEQRRLSKADGNKLSVRLELQADYLAGVWAHHLQKLKNVLEEGDAEEAMGAASAVGDDRIQKQAQGYVVPDSFTHGKSEQRKRWFLQGFKTGDARKQVLDQFFDLSYERL